MGDIPATYSELPQNLQTCEQQKFDLDTDGKVIVRTTAKGTFSPSGLNVAGKITIVTLNSSTWTALPPTALTGRNALSIQNPSNIQVKINYDNTESGYVGMIIGQDGERQYDITENVIIYAKSASGAPDIVVEELS